MYYWECLTEAPQAPLCLATPAGLNTYAYPLVDILGDPKNMVFNFRVCWVPSTSEVLPSKQNKTWRNMVTNHMPYQKYGPSWITTLESRPTAKQNRFESTRGLTLYLAAQEWRCPVTSHQNLWQDRNALPRKCPRRAF